MRAGIVARRRTGRSAGKAADRRSIAWTVGGGACVALRSLRGDARSAVHRLLAMRDAAQSARWLTAEVVAGSHASRAVEIQNCGSAREQTQDSHTAIVNISSRIIHRITARHT